MSLVMTEQHGLVATIRIDNVSRGADENFLTTRVLEELWNELVRLENDRSVRAIVLTGNGNGRFVGHYDVDEILTGADRIGVPMWHPAAPVVLRSIAPLVRRRRLRALLRDSPLGGVATLLFFHQLTRRIRTSGKVFVAAIDGPAFGGGLELALACDIRVLGDGQYELGLTEVLTGLVPGGGGTERLTALLGPAATVDLLLEGRMLTPCQAFDLGLAHHLAPQDTVVRYAQQIAARLALRSPMAVRAVKRIIEDGGRAATERGWFLTLASRAPAKTALRRYSAQVRAARLAGADPACFARTHLPEWQDGTAVEFPAPA